MRNVRFLTSSDQPPALGAPTVRYVGTPAASAAAHADAMQAEVHTADTV